MIAWLSYALMAGGLVLTGWAGLYSYLRRPTDDAVMIAAIVVEVAAVTQTVIALARLAGSAVVEPVTFIAYSLGVLLPLPLGFQLARIERTRWGSLALGFTALVVTVMTLRLWTLWR